MSSKFASSKRAIAECDICGFRYKLKQLKELIVCRFSSIENDFIEVEL